MSDDMLPCRTCGEEQLARQLVTCNVYVLEASLGGLRSFPAENVTCQFSVQCMLDISCILVERC